MHSKFQQDFCENYPRVVLTILGKRPRIPKIILKNKDSLRISLVDFHRAGVIETVWP